MSVMSEWPIELSKSTNIHYNAAGGNPGPLISVKLMFVCCAWIIVYYYVNANVKKC